MLKKMYVLFVAVMLVLSFVITAEDKTDFSGTWSFSREKSQFDQGGDRFVPVTIQVDQKDNFITLQRTYQREYEDDIVDSLSFTLDGKENESRIWNSPRIITARWSEDQKELTIKTKITFTRDGQESEMNSTDKWTLQEEGQQLSRNFTIEGPMGEMKAVYVYTKAQSE